MSEQIKVEIDVTPLFWRLAPIELMASTIARWCRHERVQEVRATREGLVLLLGAGVPHETRIAEVCARVETLRAEIQQEFAANAAAERERTMTKAQKDRP